MVDKAFIGVFLLAGTFLFVAGTYNANESIKYATGLSATVTIVDVVSEKTKRSSGAGSTTMYRPIVSLNGVRKKISKSVSEQNKFQIGKKLNVRFVSSQNSKIKIDSFWGLWMSTIICYLLSIPLLGIAVPYLYRRITRQT